LTVKLVMSDAGFPDPATHIGELHDWLSASAELYLTGDLENQRLAVATALLEVSRYLQRSGFSADLLLAVLRPGHALADLQGNAVDPLFAKRRRVGAPSATIIRSIRTAILASFANSWLEYRANDPRDQKAKLKEAAQKLTSLKIGSVSYAMLKSARERVSTETPDHPTVVFYQRFKSFLDKVTSKFGFERGFKLMIRYVNEHEISRAAGILKTRPIIGTDDE
jgi:hypothetical protein